MMTENEGLQEYIFDMEQKVVCVDLEIEKKIKEMRIPESSLRGQALSPLPKVNEDEVKELKEEIGALQQKCMIYED